MSVTNAGIQYAQSYTIAGADANLTGIQQYRKNGDLKLFFSESARADRVNLTACEQAGHPTEYNIANRQLLQEYANGDRQYYVEWVTYNASAHQYTYHTCFDITNSGGQTLGHFEQATYSWYEASPYDDSIWGKPIVWFATETDYGNNPTIGSYPEIIYPYGSLFVARIGDPVNLEGEVDRNTVYSNWLHSFPNYGISNNTDYTKFLNGEGTGSGGDITPKKPEDDTSGPGGGGGSYRPGITGDVIPVGGVPGVEAAATGLLTLYNPTLSQVRRLSQFLWSDTFLDTIKKLKNDPFESIIGFSMLPYAPSTSGSANCYIGNCDSQIEMGLCHQYKSINFSTIRIPENWGSFLDYAPYTKIEIYLPFVGVRVLNTDDVMGKTLSVVYNLDALTGAGLCTVTVDGSALYQFNCSVASHIPLTGSNKAQFIQALASVGTSAMVAGATAAAGGAVAAGAIAYSATRLALTKDRSVQRSGSLYCEHGVLGVFDPYIIIHRPIQSLPANFKHFKGYMSNISGSLGSFSGYTEVEYAHLDGVSATDTEKNEIESLLKAGVIV